MRRTSTPAGFARVRVFLRANPDPVKSSPMKPPKKYGGCIPITPLMSSNSPMPWTCTSGKTSVRSRLAARSSACSCRLVTGRSPSPRRRRMRKPNLAAACHLAVAALEKAGEVPPGEAHDLSRCQLTLTMPAFAAVSRAAGQQRRRHRRRRDRRAGGVAGRRAAVSDADSGPMRHPPGAGRAKRAGHAADVAAVHPGRGQRRQRGSAPEAKPPAAWVRLTQPQPPPKPRRTSAKRVGADEIVIALKRIPKSAFR